MINTQPIAKPHAGSINRVEYAENEPATGNSTANSPRACTVQYNIIPMRLKHMSNDAGPPCDRDCPDATKRPLPVNNQTCMWRVSKGAPTNGSSNGNHLKMSTLKPSRQRRVGSCGGRIFMIEYPSVCANCPFRRNGEVRVPFEAVKESLRKAGLDFCPLLVNRFPSIAAAVGWRRRRLLVRDGIFLNIIATAHDGYGDKELDDATLLSGSQFEPESTVAELAQPDGIDNVLGLAVATAYGDGVWRRRTMAREGWGRHDGDDAGDGGDGDYGGDGGVVVYIASHR